jgi:sugar phosphate isomerase/epimerase
MQGLLRKVQINIPFTMLNDSYLNRFLTYGVNPEIGIDAAALERFSFSDFSRIAGILQDNCLNITLHGPFYDLSPGSIDPALLAVTRNRFEQVLELVPVFKPQTVVLHAGFDRKRHADYLEEWIENSLETWTWMASCLLESGTRLMLENVYEHGPQDIRMIFERLENQNVGFCLDSGHLSAFGHSPLTVWLKSMGPYIEQLHLHDNHGEEDDHLPMGSGAIDFKPLFNYLKSRRNPSPIITLEPHSEADLWQSLAYLSEVWPL